MDYKTAAFKEGLTSQGHPCLCPEVESWFRILWSRGTRLVETTSPGGGVLSRVQGFQRPRRSWEGSQAQAVSAGSATRPLCQLGQITSLWKPSDMISGSLLCLWNVWSTKGWIICYTETVHRVLFPHFATGNLLTFLLRETHQKNKHFNHEQKCSCYFTDSRLISITYSNFTKQSSA